LRCWNGIPIGSSFYSDAGTKFLIVVAPNLNAQQPDIHQIRAFISDGSQGVNYRAGTWHHPLLTLESPAILQ
jgi:ureidoglycolate lyase